VVGHSAANFILLRRPIPAGHEKKPPSAFAKEAASSAWAYREEK
jgi:hypothetical protein